MTVAIVYTDGLGKFYTADGKGEFAPNGAEILKLPQLDYFRTKLLAARSDPNALSPAVAVIGDSITEGVGASHTYNRWGTLIRQRIQAAAACGACGVGFIPATGNIFNDGWVGGASPWSYTVQPGGDGAIGIDWHGGDLASGQTATITYFGQFLQIIYSESVDGPTACAFSQDGGSASTFNARNAGTVKHGKVVTTGLTSYGFHTVTITPNDGPLKLEGVLAFDADFFFAPLGGVNFFVAGHSGYRTDMWGANGVPPFPGGDQWTGIFTNAYGAQMGLLVVALGVNDEGALSSAQYRDNLIGIVNRLDASLGHHDCSIMFVILPGIQTYGYVTAANEACYAVGQQRAATVDLAALRPNRVFGPDLSADGPPDYVHPNDAGHKWIADQLYHLFDPLPTAFPPITPSSQTKLATDVPTSRASWASNIITSGGATFDQSPSGTTQGERRTRVWLDAGIYRVTVYYQRDTGLGTMEVLLGRFNNMKSELISVGSIATAGAGPSTQNQVFGTTVTTDVPGWCPIVIRKTTASGAVRFVQVALDKVG